MSNLYSKWYEAVIQDPKLLSGTSVRQFLEPLVALLGLKFVLIKGLSGAIPGLSDLDEKMIAVDVFMRRVESAVQYDWAFFHFYSMLPKNMRGDDIERINFSDLTVRLVDGAFFYVYSRNAKVLDRLKMDHVVSECVFAELIEFDIPY